MTRPIKGTGTPCSEVEGCPRPAYYRISIKGALADQAAPAYPCRLHTTSVLTRFTAISNDVHVRSVNNVRTI